MVEVKTDINFLRKKSKKIDRITEEVKGFVLEMAKTMEESGGIGLAAPQVGRLERIIVVKEGNGFSCFINPVILKKSKEKDLMEEGCLSLPGRRLEIKRPIRIKAKALNLNGEEVILELEDFASRVFQHEVDHLDGILIIDRVPLVQKIKSFLNKK